MLRSMEECDFLLPLDSSLILSQRSPFALPLAVFPWGAEGILSSGMWQEWLCLKGSLRSYICFSWQSSEQGLSVELLCFPWCSDAARKSGAR